LKIPKNQDWAEDTAQNDSIRQQSLAEGFLKTFM